MDIVTSVQWVTHACLLVKPKGSKDGGVLGIVALDGVAAALQKKDWHRVTVFANNARALKSLLQLRVNLIKGLDAASLPCLS